MLPLDLRDCTLFGSALPEPFVRFEFPAFLAARGLLPKSGTVFEAGWTGVRRHLRGLGRIAGPQRVHNHVLAALADPLGYRAAVRADDVQTREGAEDGGWLFSNADGIRLRTWSVGSDTDLDAPRRSGRAYRFSATRCAQRVLRASGERAGLLTDGDTLRLLVCDPAGPDSHLTIPLTGTTGWREQPLAPDSYRALVALVAPAGLAALPDILDAARLSQARVTRDLRLQAKAAVEGFLQGVLDHPANRLHTANTSQLAATLWAEGLILVYRLLFILKLESAADPAHAFSFASSALWRGCLSPNRALGPFVRRHLDQAHDTGHLLEAGLRTLFRAFRDGLTCSELTIAPLGGALFGRKSTPLLDRLSWGERPVALLLDRLLWATPKGRERERVHYAALDVEDLGSVYEGLLELEPGIASEPMARLRRAKLEIVVPAHQAEPYRTPADATRAAWAEDIPTGRFFLRAGLGRKATGSFYTPHAFVQFLVREALGPCITAASPDHDPDPAALLAIKVLDPAVGSGHFLVETCRFLGEALYTASRLCDELASTAEAAANDAPAAERASLLARAAALRHRLAALPDPDATLLTYLPSRVREGGDSGLSQQRALAICRRLVAVHCLYGVDRNSLAVELAKLSLWLESYAEGLPLTFLDHRLIRGDSITGPFFSQLELLPVGRQPLDPLLARGVTQRLNAALAAALAEIETLEATVGKDIADLSLKQAANARLDRSLAPLRLLARAWSGAAMLATREADDEWLALARHLADAGAWPTALTARQSALLAAGTEALPWDLTFPDIFHRAAGFDVVLGNPPWDVVQYSTRDFVAAVDPRILDAETKQERLAIERRVLADDGMRDAFHHYKAMFDRKKRIADRLFQHQRTGSGRDATAGNLDDFRLFAERSLRLAAPAGAIGMLLPSAFHANEGTTAIRQLYLDRTRLDYCLSFENRRKLFDIDSRFKFSLLVARRPGPTESFRCAFYLDSMAQIADPLRLMTYDRAFLTQAGGKYLTFPELRGPADLAVGRTMLAAGSRLAAWCQANGIRFGRDLHMTDDAAHFVRISKLLRRGETIADPVVAARLNDAGYLILHEGKTFHQYTDTWDTAPRYAVPTDALRQKPTTQEASTHVRLVFRDIARTSDERTMIAAIAPPGVIFGHTATVERAPGKRPDSAALLLCALFNAYPFDWLVRQKAATHLSLYIVEDLPVPDFQPGAAEFLARAVLRLSCNHQGYIRLWRTFPQLTGKARGPWPVVPAADTRWHLRTAMDAVIAWSYGLDEPGYARILSSFNHKSFRRAPELCLAAFREISARGMAAFCADQGTRVRSEQSIPAARR